MSENDDKIIDAVDENCEKEDKPLESEEPIVKLADDIEGEEGIGDVDDGSDRNGDDVEDKGGEEGDDVEGGDDVVEGDDDELSLGGSEGSDENMDVGGDDVDNEPDDDDAAQEPATKKAKKSSSSAATDTSGWADAMSKILASDKSILSKAKKDKDVVMKKTNQTKKDAAEKEIQVVSAEGGGGDGGDGKAKEIGEEGNEDGKKDKRKAEAALKAINYGRTKPHLFEKQFERSLSRIATRGVIQLFNAVNKHQKETKDKIKKDGKSEFKKDAILKSVSKGDFIDLLKDNNNKVNEGGGRKGEDKKKKNETAKGASLGDQLPVTESTWKILRDDFMMTKGKTLKDWDKESDSD